MWSVQTWMQKKLDEWGKNKTNGFYLLHLLFKCFICRVQKTFCSQVSREAHCHAAITTFLFNKLVVNEKTEIFFFGTTHFSVKNLLEYSSKAFPAFLPTVFLLPFQPIYTAIFALESLFFAINCASIAQSYWKAFIYCFQKPFTNRISIASKRASLISMDIKIYTSRVFIVGNPCYGYWICVWIDVLETVRCQPKAFRFQSQRVFAYKLFTIHLKIYSCVQWEWL